MRKKRKPSLTKLIGSSLVYQDDLLDVVDVDEHGDIVLDDNGDEIVVPAIDLVADNDELQPYIDAYGWDNPYDDPDDGGGDPDDSNYDPDNDPDYEGVTGSVVDDVVIEKLDYIIELLENSNANKTNKPNKEDNMAKATKKAEALYNGEWYDVTVKTDHGDGTYTVTDGEYDWDVGEDEIKFTRSRSRSRSHSRNNGGSRSGGRGRSNSPKNKAQERMALLEEEDIQAGDTIEFKPPRARKWTEAKVISVNTAASRWKGCLKVVDADDNELTIDPLEYKVRRV